MRIKIDRDYTAGHEVPQVKADITEFKERYTEMDILHIIRAQLDFWNFGEVIKFEAEAFPGGSFYNNETHFNFSIILDDGGANMYKISAYMNIDGNIPNPELCRIRRYKFSGEKAGY